jgi:hypothetical protein
MGEKGNVPFDGQNLHIVEHALFQDSSIYDFARFGGNFQVIQIL